MTTKVQLINHGPDKVLLEVMSKTVQPATDNSTQLTIVAPVRSYTLSAGSVGPEIYLYDSQFIAVSEQK